MKNLLNQKGFIIIGLVFISLLVFQNLLLKSNNNYIEVQSYIEKNEIFSPIQPYLILNSENQPNLNFLAYFYETQFESFADELIELNTIALSLDNNQFKLIYSQNFDEKITKSEFNKIKNEWEIELKKFLVNYFNEVDTKIVFIKNSVMEKLTYNRLHVYFERLEGSKKYQRYEICGYKNVVKQLIYKINHENKIEL